MTDECGYCGSRHKNTIQPLSGDYEDVLRPFDRVHLAQLTNGWQLSVRRKNQDGWIVVFSKTVVGAMENLSAGRQQDDPGPPDFEDPLT